MVNVGNDLTFRNATSGTVLSLANLNADLTSIYGSGWNTRNELLWGVFGSRNGANPTVYASKKETPYGSSAASYSVLNLTARSSANSAIISVLDAYGNLTASANNSKAAQQTNSTASSSYAAQVGTAGTSDFGSLSGWNSIEDSFTNGTGGTALDLFRFASVSGSDVVQRLGSFSISSGGAVSFLAGPPPNQIQVAASAVAVQENAGTVNISFQRLGDATSSASDATFSVTPGTAAAGTDYTVPNSLTVSFVANQTSASASIPVINRTGFHGPRSFTVNLVSATGGFVVGASVATTVTIGELDQDPGALDFTAASFATSTANSSVDVTLQRTSGNVGAVAVSVSVTGGTLVNGTDFSFTTPTVVTFADGVTSATTTIALSTLKAGSITLGLSNPTNFSRVGAQSSATINVAGAPGVLSWSAARYSFPETAGVVSIPVRRTSGVQGQVSVTVNTANGTATAGSDYTALSAYTATLDDSVSTVNIPVTLLSAAQPVSETNETFTIILSNPSNGATLGAIATATVRIEKYDTTAPTVAISTPVAGARITTSTVNVVGVVTDDKGVDHVELQLNGGNIVSLTPSGNPNLTSGAFSRALTLVPGLNTLTVQSVDAAGNVSPAVTRTFTFVKTSPLTVTIDPQSPANSGTLTAPFPNTDPAREEGKSYTITATPKAGFVFAGWSGTGITGTAAAELPALTFVHKAGLTITAKFVATPFTSAAVGQFTGLIKALVPANASQATNGFIDVTVTTTGSFTGTLKIDNLSLPTVGTLTSDGKARFGTAKSPTFIAAHPDKPNSALAFQVDLSPTGTHQATGTLGTQSRSTITPQSSFTANRAAYAATNPPAASLQGLHTIALLSLTQTNGLTATDYPQGDGVGSATVSSAGVVTFKGNLADGTPFTATAPLSKTSASSHQVPFFAQPYANKGAIGATIAFDTTLADAVLSSTDVLWFKPFIAGQYYPFGWVEGVTSEVIGSKYNPAPATANVVPGLPPVNNFLGNATLVLTNGKLAGALSKDVNISAANAVSKVPAINPTFELKVTPVSGDISGTFTHTDGTKPPYQGKIVQKGPDAGTYGYFLTTSPKVPTGDGESGRVTLNHK